ncbi:hypothetical protein DV515_00015506 [Chloebia gouldiae]|uniref:Mucolipin extracytosolic domain-containing protein n=1 Tax=Chloebia gouldiae TaxID=44316 RepID=A0A3L8RWC4_CHLGU|nr:hypothetical protein DV515_00015506 [Chloebia gouldiae]
MGGDRGGGLCPQLILFRLSSQLVVAFKEYNMVAFKHLFPKGYKDGTNDTQAIYTSRDFLEHLAFVLKKYLAVLHETFGHHTYGRGHGRCFWNTEMFWGHGDVLGPWGVLGPPRYPRATSSLGVPVPVVPNGTLGHYAYGGTESDTRLHLCQRFCRVDIKPSNNIFDINPCIITGGDTWGLRGFGLLAFHDLNSDPTVVLGVHPRDTRPPVLDGTDDNVTLQFHSDSANDSASDSDGDSDSDGGSDSNSNSHNANATQCLQVMFDTHAHSERVQIHLDTHTSIRECHHSLLPSRGDTG